MKQPPRSTIWHFSIALLVLGLGIACLTASLRLLFFDQVLHGYSYTGFLLTSSLISGSYWAKSQSEALVVLFTFSLCTFFHFGILTVILGLIASEFSAYSIEWTRKFTRILAQCASSTRRRLAQIADGEKRGRWVKEHLPGLHYKVTVPNEVFRRRVQEELENERKNQLTTNTEKHQRIVRYDGESLALDSLSVISDGFGLGVRSIQSDMASRSTVLTERFQDIHVLLERIIRKLGPRE